MRKYIWLGRFVTVFVAAACMVVVCGACNALGGVGGGGGEDGNGEGGGDGDDGQCATIPPECDADADCTWFGDFCQDGVCVVG